VVYHGVYIVGFIDEVEDSLFLVPVHAHLLCCLFEVAVPPCAAVASLGCPAQRLQFGHYAFGKLLFVILPPMLPVAN
jgi:hypothetical protein